MDRKLTSVCRCLCYLLIMLCDVVGTYAGIDDDPLFSLRSTSFPLQNGGGAGTPCQQIPKEDTIRCEDRHLQEVPSYFPDSTLRLFLAKNDIQVLLNTSLQPYPNLLLLDCRLNGLKLIQSAAFGRLERLKFLFLSINIELVIPNSAPFQSLKSLLILDLNHCYLEQLPNDLLDWLPKLKYLWLKKNRLRSVNVSRCKTDRLNEALFSNNQLKYLTPDKFIYDCPTEKFDLSRNPIRNSSEDTISRLPVRQLLLGINSIENTISFDPTESILLDLFKGIAKSTIDFVFVITMNLERIPGKIFSPMQYHAFEAFYIIKCEVLSLYDNVFFGLNYLKTLYIADNFIRRIEPEYFSQMPGLTSLILNDNLISEINTRNSTWGINLFYLLLSRNKLISVDGYQLRGLCNLTVFNLSDNDRLFYLDLRSYSWLDNLQTVDVSGTILVKLDLAARVYAFYFVNCQPHGYNIRPLIPGQTFNNTALLEIADLSHSDIKLGNIWDSFSKVSLLRGLSRLRELYLSNNPLGNLPEGVFEDNLSLVDLRMSNCEISSLASNMFKGLQDLRHLDLNKNNLISLSADTLKDLPMLEILDIDENRLMFVEEGALENVKHLRKFGLSDNQIVAFNRSTWNTLRNYDLEYIDVSGNPLACQCAYGWLHDLANSSEMFLHQSDTLCSVDSLDTLHGEPLLAFDPNKYCAPNIILISTLPFVVLALLIGLLLAFHNRWLIRYKLFLVKLAVIGYREMQDAREHGEFVFDLNIMFTEADEAWAKEYLRPTLEERLPDYDRYSFGDEDLTLGMHYLEAVHYAVEHSFKTILLLSRRAVRDNWFLIKLRTAMDHVHDEMIENTVIFLEDIPENEIPYLVRLYLSDRRPYMRWPEHIRGREYFWNELTKVVTVNLRFVQDYDRYSFGDEELTLGMHYLEAVHYAVENSFKTIMLLSRRAVRDNWFLIKFRTAMDHAHDELTENTVVIFLEDIPEDEIPYLVRLYLSDRRPYMRWPEHIRGREYFWNELTKVVTVNLRYNPLIPSE